MCVWSVALTQQLTLGHYFHLWHVNLLPHQLLLPICEAHTEMHTHTHTSRKHANAYAWTCACVWLCNNLTDSWRCCGLQLQLLQQQQQELQEHAACWQLPDTRQLVYLPHTWTAHVHTTQPPTVLVNQVRIRTRQPTASSRWPGLAKRRGQQASAEQLNNNAWVIMQLTAKSINDVNYMPTTGQPNSHTHTEA